MIRYMAAFQLPSVDFIGPCTFKYSSNLSSECNFIHHAIAELPPCCAVYPSGYDPVVAINENCKFLIQSQDEHHRQASVAMTTTSQQSIAMQCMEL